VPFAELLAAEWKKFADLAADGQIGRRGRGAGRCAPIAA